ncbi:MAG: DNA-binding NtrC family response regulator [Polyangiales bacterium]|jgi:DNA-binding NtrC family response regulator
MSEGRILLVDDDDGFRFAMSKALRRLGYEVSGVGSGEEALARLSSKETYLAMLLDLRMKGISGLEVLKRRGNSPVAAVVLTGHGSVQAAVEAMRLGAFSFLEKPVDAEELAPILKSAVADTKRNLGETQSAAIPPLIGTSKASDDVRRFVDTVGPTRETVTLFGETGTGKEVVALHLHHASGRQGAFVALNAACVPRDLFESELFGHKRGSFTGATSDRAGLFRDASGGTLFVDELGELPIDLQAKLLRVLETRKVRGVGESMEHEVDARIVAATNRDLWQDVQDGRFREDLYFRLQVFPLVLRPLRERREDIVPMAERLLTRVSTTTSLSESAKEALIEYDWPGNVRELLNVLRRAALFAEAQEMEASMIRRMIAASVFGHREARAAAPSTPPSDQSLADVERSHIERVLTSLGGNITQAAVQLGIDRRTLQRKLKAFGWGEE